MFAEISKEIEEKSGFKVEIEDALKIQIDTIGPEFKAFYEHHLDNFKDVWFKGMLAKITEEGTIDLLESLLNLRGNYETFEDFFHQELQSIQNLVPDKENKARENTSDKAALMEELRILYKRRAFYQYARGRILMRSGMSRNGAFQDLQSAQNYFLARVDDYNKHMAKISDPKQKDNYKLKLKENQANSAACSYQMANIQKY